RVREIHESLLSHGRAGPAHLRHASVFKTSLLIAFSVSNTPSRVTATASKYVARSTHSPVGTCSMRFSPAWYGSGTSRCLAGSGTSHPGFSAACSSLSGEAFGRSRLLYWMANGTKSAVVLLTSFWAAVTRAWVLVRLTPVASVTARMIDHAP